MIKFEKMSDEQRNKDREQQLILEQRRHEERAAMIEHGMVPPTFSPAQKAQNLHVIYNTLGCIGCIPSVCALMAGGAHGAWIAAGAIGVVAAVGAVIVFVKNN